MEGMAGCERESRNDGGLGSGDGGVSMHAEPQIHSPGLGLRTSHTRTNIPTPPSPETPLGPCSASISSWSGNFANSLHNVTCSRRLNFTAANQNRGNDAIAARDDMLGCSLPQTQLGCSSILCAFSHLPLFASLSLFTSAQIFWIWP